MVDAPTRPIQARLQESDDIGILSVAVEELTKLRETSPPVHTIPATESGRQTVKELDLHSRPPPDKLLAIIKPPVRHGVPGCLIIVSAIRG